MSGKLIIKRKFDRTQQSSINNKMEADESSSDSTTASSSTSTIKTQNKQTNKSDESYLSRTENKRIRCDTPPPEPENLYLPSLGQVNEQNRRFLEAIQSKMLELQNELDAFEHDVEAHEEDYYYINDLHSNHQNNQMSEQNAEALGYAMCAQETMLFLQREGIPADSLLYTRLRDALVGRSQSDRIFISEKKN